MLYSLENIIPLSRWILGFKLSRFEGQISMQISSRASKFLWSKSFRIIISANFPILKMTFHFPFHKEIYGSSYFLHKYFSPIFFLQGIFAFRRRNVPTIFPSIKKLKARISKILLYFFIKAESQSVLNFFPIRQINQSNLSFPS